MFQIKNFPSIVASIINRMKGSNSAITDYNVGSVARTLIEAPAAEIDELYQQIFNGLLEAIPNATYNSFNFPALGAVAASNVVVVTITAQASDVLISAGTAFTVNGGAVPYSSAVDTTISAGSTTANVLVVASQAGVIGNLPASGTFTMNPIPNGFVSATNTVAFSNGLDAETDDQRKQRFNEYINSLQRGTVEALEFGAETAALFNSAGVQTEKVKFASVDEPWITDDTQPISLVNVYVHNGVGSTSSPLVTLVNQILYGYTDASGNKIAGWKAAGVKVVVAAATELPVNIGGTITALPGFDEPTLATAANAAVGAYILGLDLAGTFEVAQMYFLVKSIPGVDNFSPANLAPPSAPSLGSAVAGSLAGATYYVKTTYVNSKGETLPSAEASHAVAANSVLTVASPPALIGATGWNVYVSTATGTETLQNVSPIAIGTGFTEPTSGLVAGDEMPVISTAVLADITSTKAQKLMPGTMSIA